MLNRSASSTTLAILFFSIISSMVCPCDSFLPVSLTRSRHRNGYQYIGDVTTPSSISLAKDLPIVQFMGKDSEMPSKECKRLTGDKILDLAVPALGALLIDPLLTLADTAFVGRFSETANELAGMGSFITSDHDRYPITIRTHTPFFFFSQDRRLHS